MHRDTLEFEDLQCSELNVCHSDSLRAALRAVARWILAAARMRRVAHTGVVTEGNTCGAISLVLQSFWGIATSGCLCIPPRNDSTFYTSNSNLFI